MSVDLGTAGWDLVGVVDGFALITHAVIRKSRWLDTRTWPPKLLPVRDEWTMAVCPGATLAGWTAQSVFTWKAPDKRRTQIKLPANTGVRTVGFLDAKPAVVPGFLGVHRLPPLRHPKAPMIFDGTWRALDGAGGSDPSLSAIVPLDGGGALVVWDGRVLRYADGALTETAAGDLPRAHPNIYSGFVSCGDGFVTAAGGKLVWVQRGGKHREDRAVGKLQIVSVAQYEDRLLVREASKHWLYDAETRAVERLDLGADLPDPRVLFWAPCGLLGLVDQERVLVRFRV